MKEYTTEPSNDDIALFVFCGMAGIFIIAFALLYFGLSQFITVGASQ